VMPGTVGTVPTRSANRKSGSLGYSRAVPGHHSLGGNWGVEVEISVAIWKKPRAMVQERSRASSVSTGLPQKIRNTLCLKICIRRRQTIMIRLLKLIGLRHSSMVVTTM
jgi:hypothetical protein